MSCPDCNTPIVLDLPLRLLSIPSLGQISGPLNNNMGAQKVFKDVGDAYVQSYISESSMYIPPAGTQARSQAQQNWAVEIRIFTALRHVWAPPESKGALHCGMYYFAVHIWYLLISQMNPGMAAIGGHSPFGTIRAQAHGTGQQSTFPLRFKALCSQF